MLIIDWAKASTSSASSTSPPTSPSPPPPLIASDDEEMSSSSSSSDENNTKNKNNKNNDSDVTANHQIAYNPTPPPAPVSSYYDHGNYRAIERRSLSRKKKKERYHHHRHHNKHRAQQQRQKQEREREPPQPHLQHTTGNAPLSKKSNLKKSGGKKKRSSRGRKIQFSCDPTLTAYVRGNWEISDEERLSTWHTGEEYEMMKANIRVDIRRIKAGSFDPTNLNNTIQDHYQPSPPASTTTPVCTYYDDSFCSRGLEHLSSISEFQVRQRRKTGVVRAVLEEQLHQRVHERSDIWGIMDASLELSKVARELAEKRAERDARDARDIFEDTDWGQVMGEVRKEEEGTKVEELKDGFAMLDVNGMEYERHDDSGREGRNNHGKENENVGRRNNNTTKVSLINNTTSNKNKSTPKKKKSVRATPTNHAKNNPTSPTPKTPKKVSSRSLLNNQKSSYTIPTNDNLKKASDSSTTTQLPPSPSRTTSASLSRRDHYIQSSGSSRILCAVRNVEETTMTGFDVVVLRDTIGLV